MAGKRRIRKFKTTKEMEEAIDDLITQGYSVVDQGKRTAALERRSWGDPGTHAIILLLTVWLCLGGANAVYAIIAYMSPEEMYLKVEPKKKKTDEEESDDDSDLNFA